MYPDRYQNGKRDSWTFPYTGKELLRFATGRMEYHQARERFWEEEESKTEEEIRSKGISLQEYAVTGGTRFEAKIDTSLGTRLTECREKVEKHRALKEQFEVFVMEFGRNPDRSFELAPADIRFFGLLDDETQFGDETLK